MLSIPGTHDSGTYPCQSHQFCDISQCQSWNISNQLNGGIRFLDIRVNANQGSLAVGHGSYQFIGLTEFLNQVSNFLR
jgi:1-phosphatidylinositol phosphodiesterase